MRVCVVTGTRAEYGLLTPLMKELKIYFKLQVVVTGAHLSKEHGYTVKEVMKNFKIADRVDLVLDDTVLGVTRSLGIGVMLFADTFEKLKPDIVVLLGDRYEMLAAAQAAMIAKIPIAHIAGGDTTEGAFDEAIRHSITKMAHIHFTTNEESARRVRQMGENPDYIFNVGSPGIDAIKQTRILSREELEKELGVEFKDKNLLIIFHPATLDDESPAEQFAQLLGALRKLDYGYFFIMPNADTGRSQIAGMVDGFADGRAFASLPHETFVSLLTHCDALVGNSSCGIYEAAAVGTPAVNIGDRQKGRTQTVAVVNCEPRTDDILKAIDKALQIDCSNIINPYGDGTSARKMVDILRRIDNPKSLLKKKFHDVTVFKGG